MAEEKMIKLFIVQLTKGGKAPFKTIQIEKHRAGLSTALPLCVYN
jgi:hypothetical protein